MVHDSGTHPPVGLADYSRVGMLGLRNTSVNLRENRQLRTQLSTLEKFVHFGEDVPGHAKSASQSWRAQMD